MEWTNVTWNHTDSHQSILAQLCLLGELEYLKLRTQNVALDQSGPASWYFWLGLFDWQSQLSIPCPFTGLVCTKAENNHHWMHVSDMYLHYISYPSLSVHFTCWLLFCYSIPLKTMHTSSSFQPTDWQTQMKNTTINTSPTKPRYTTLNCTTCKNLALHESQKNQTAKKNTKMLQSHKISVQFIGKNLVNQYNSGLELWTRWKTSKIIWQK